jgi:ribonuclease-3
MSTQFRRRLAALLKRSGAANVDPAAVEQAFVHESAARERGGASNERLEFFGDSLLGFVTARWLMARYPDAPEGELHRRKASMVSGDACAQSARRLGFGELMQLGVGMQHSGGTTNASILADAFEAYLGALSFQTTFETVAAFLENEHFPHVDNTEAADADAKTALQEFTQARFSIAPTYFERAEGPAHDRRFTSQVRIADEIVGEGIGASKKAAQQSAAAMALASLRNRLPEAPEPDPEPDPEPPTTSPDRRVIALRPSRNRTKAP